YEARSLDRPRQPPVPLFLGDGENVLVVGDRDIVDQNIDAAEALHYRLDHRSDVAGLGDVGREQFGLAARPLDRAHDALAPPPVDVDDRNLGALGGEQLGDLLADIASGPSHDRNLIFELHRSAHRPRPTVITFTKGTRQQGRPRGIAANMIGEMLRTWISPWPRRSRPWKAPTSPP